MGFRILRIVLTTLLNVTISVGAVGFDAIMTGGNVDGGRAQSAGAVTSISSTGMTLGGSATCIVASLVFTKSGAPYNTVPTGISVTWNSVAMTAGPIVSSTAGNDVTAVLFILASPATGNKTLAATWTNAQAVYMGAVSFTGTDTATCIKASDNQTAIDTTSITVTSSTNGATVAVFNNDGGAPTINFTTIWKYAVLSPGGGASYTLGGSSNVHTFTGGGGSAAALGGVHVVAPSVSSRLSLLGVGFWFPGFLWPYNR
jgi:hypothetical protein